MKKDFSAKAYRNDLKEKGVFHTDSKLAEIIKSYGKERPKNVYDPTCGFRVIIMTQANSQVNTRVLKLLPKLKIKKMNCWCAV